MPLAIKGKKLNKIPCLGCAGDCGLLLIGAVIIAGDSIQFTHFRDLEEKIIIKNVSSMRNTAYKINESYSNRTIDQKIHPIELRGNFLYETPLFINKCSNDMVLINIHLVINDIDRNMTNNITMWSEMEMKKVTNHNRNITINFLLYILDDDGNHN